MKALTEEDFCQAIDADLAWRKKELSYYRSLAQAKSKSATGEALVRAGIAMLYAHWEGFVKFAASYYVKYVAVRRMPCSALSRNFLALAALKRLKSRASRGDLAQIQAVVDFVLLQQEERPNIDWEVAVNTRANLNSEVMREILDSLGLDYGPYELKAHLIDERLLGQRNQIAHGRHLSVGVESYLELHDVVVNLMDQFRAQIENAVVVKLYRSGR